MRWSVVDGWMLLLMPSDVVNYGFPCTRDEKIFDLLKKLRFFCAWSPTTIGKSEERPDRLVYAGRNRR